MFALLCLSCTHFPLPSLEILSTVGVDLGIWRYRKDLEPELRGKRRNLKAMKSVTFYTWDFGGQEEYYVTHQCFLSTRSLYLVVWDVEKGEEGVEELGPWLHNIQVRGHWRMGWTIWQLSCALAMQQESLCYCTCMPPSLFLSSPSSSPSFPPSLPPSLFLSLPPPLRRGHLAPQSS